MVRHSPILLAEDSADDGFVIRRAIEILGLPNELVVAHDGREVIDFLEGVAKQRGRKSNGVPGLFLLDLRMPLVDGFDVLVWLQGQPCFKEMPVIILSDSGLDYDMQKAHQLGAADYCVKSAKFDDLVTTLQKVCRRWLRWEQ